ncbi:universal stress protein family protein [Pacificibacter maritimus]|uniref:Universal stress protein family protein n=1 Tax=Pacificibacter maritimus TaxID=762213 RepID=A0A3N4UN64_9RHOB|nr:universal stress protein [Pacificibacter maritimus]RPE66477.1 universal stress protein family protein [Pacificibacter maritimus]
MSYKSISTLLCDAKQDLHILDAAIALARQHDAHLDIICLGLDRTQPGFYYSGANAIILQDKMNLAQDESQAIETAVLAHMEPQDIRWSTRPMVAQMAGLAVQIAQVMRFSDLVILPRPYGKGREIEHERIIEAALFSARRPVLVMPANAALPASLNTAVTAWNESTEALNAIRAALPMLQDAKQVDITIIDPPKHGPDRSDPGGALCQMLARHSVDVEVSVLAKTMPRVADVLMRHVQDKSADILVMGAYGHSRLRESILGGATRHILENVEIPVFMAH